MDVLYFALSYIAVFVAGAFAHRWLAAKSSAVVATIAADIEKKI